MAWGVIAGVVTGVIGAAASASSQSAARDAQQQAIDRQHDYNVKRYNYDWEETLRSYDYRMGEVATQRQNLENELRYREASDFRRYQDDLAIRAFDYGNQVRQFNESERIYGLQLGFNNMASQLAHQAENRRFQEIVTGMAFDQQDMLVKMLQEEGQIQAAGVSGRSAGKVLSSALASYGRNQAILAESLTSAKKDSRVARNQIDLQKYGADLQAQSRRMLKPLLAPAPSAPLKMPRATLLDPLKPVKPPEPIKAANTVLGPSPLSIANNAVGGFMSGYSFGKQFDKT